VRVRDVRQLVVLLAVGFRLEPLDTYIARALTT
jgi:hypothetical protein